MEVIWYALKSIPHCGMNFIDYVTQYRMNKARELLRNTDMKINEIAESVGYQPAYFIRLFKKAEGLTPGQYRENAHRVVEAARCLISLCPYGCPIVTINAAWSPR